MDYGTLSLGFSEYYIWTSHHTTNRGPARLVSLVISWIFLPPWIIIWFEKWIVGGGAHRRRWHCEMPRHSLTTSWKITNALYSFQTF
jgi:hypothetical protein